MRWPAPTVFGAVRPHIPRALVGEVELAACRELAERVPFEVDAYYLECRLDHVSQVDFLVLTHGRRDAAVRLERALGADFEPETWGRSLNLLRAGPDAVLDGAQLVWFEYDVDERLNLHEPVASPSLCLEPGYLFRNEYAPRIDQSAALERARAAMRHLVAPERYPAVKRTVERCHATLPEQGSLVYVSEMLTRMPSVTKLYVALPVPGVLPFLTEIGWPGRGDDVRDMLGTYCRDAVDTAFLDLSISDELTGRLGLAFSQFHRREMPSFDPCWGWLPMAGVSVEKREALAAWPGQSEARIRGARCSVMRWLDIKVVLDETRRLQHKAYLGFKPAIRRLQ